MKINLILTAFVFSLICAGCSHQEPDAEAIGFQNTSLGDGGVFSIKSADALKGYDSIYLKSMTTSADSELEDTELVALEYAFQNAITSNLGTVLPVVEAPGAKSLLVEATISGVLSPSPLAGAGVTSNNPAEKANDYGAAAVASMPISTNAYGQIAGTKLCVSNIQVKIRFLDSSGQLLAVFSDSTFGADIELNSNGKTSWSRVSDAFNHWCGELSSQLSSAIGE